MIKLKAAFATDNGKTFMERHFGDAEYYDIYEIDKDQANFINRISNTVDEEEEVHADPQKAKGIISLLLDEDVSVVVSKIFGPNIKRIKKKFVCIIINENELANSIDKIKSNLQTISVEWDKGNERNFLKL